MAPILCFVLGYLCRRTSPARGIGASVTGRPATRPVSGWADSSRWSTLEDTIVTGVCTLDWKSSDLAIKPTQFELQWLEKRRLVFEIAQFSNKEKQPELVTLDKRG